jgi:diguanylate cyclase (GGDEF)-like protein
MAAIRTTNAANSARQAMSDSTRRLAEPPASRIQLLATFFVILLCSWLSIFLSRQCEGVATIWLSNGMLFALVITRPRSCWLRYFIISFIADNCANLLCGDSLPLSLGVATANSLEVILSCLFLTRWFGNPFNLSKRRPLVGFLVIAVTGVPVLTSILAASWTMLFRVSEPWWSLVRTWYLGDVLGMAIIAPLVFILQRPGFFFMLRRRQLPQTLAIVAIPAIVAALVFNHRADPLTFFVFPALLFVVFRRGFPGTVLAIFVVASISIVLTVAGRGPLMLIVGSTMAHRIVIVQIFVAVALFTTFPVAALLEERKNLERSLLRSEQRYRDLANVDALTGLANRRGFDLQLEAEWLRSAHSRKSLAILIIDVDFFKLYNDIYGHIGGDECLRSIANIIADSLHRSSDRASRFGGEEFAVILPATDLPAALVVAENIRRSVFEMNIPHSGNPHGHQTVSIGVAAIVPTTGESAVYLLNLSDVALYRAKELGRNRVEATLPTATFVLN